MLCSALQIVTFINISCCFTQVKEFLCLWVYGYSTTVIKYMGQIFKYIYKGIDMNENETKESKDSNRIAFESLEILVKKWMDGSLKEILDDWKWIFSYSRKYKWAIVYSTFMGIVSSTMGLISSVVSKHLLDIITGYKTEYLWVLITMMVGSTAFSLIIGNWLGRFNLKLSIKINQDIRADIFDKIMDAEWLSMNKYPNGDILNRFNSDTNTISSNAISWIPSVILAIYNFAATFFVILHYDVVMAILAFASAPFMFLVSAIVMKKRRAYAKKVREMSSDMMSFEVETFYNYDTIKSFGIAPHYSKKLRWWQEKYKNLSLEYNLFNIKINVFTSIVSALVQGGAFFYCLWRLWTRDITFGTMQLFLTQRSKLASAFSSVTGIVPAFLNTSISAHRIRELVDLPRETHIPQSSEMDQFIANGFTVEMRDVNFSYIAEKQIITNSSFIAKPGEIVALVGPSGEGKTTMIRLILGLIKPQIGRTVLRASNGIEVDMNADTRHLFAYVPQGNTILSGTIADNMRMVKENATDEEIIEALKTACAWDFVSQIPDGIHSKIGERGRGFSEGQAQRIAIARAILRDAPILLLDEATSALDITTERMVLRNIVQQKPNKTCIVTTHRPSVLNLCQRVYRVMETHVTELSEEESSKMAINF